MEYKSTCASVRKKKYDTKQEQYLQSIEKGKNILPKRFLEKILADQKSRTP